MGFEVRCPISRIERATAWLKDAEKQKSTESMIAEGAPEHGPASATPKSNREKCNEKMSPMAALGLGGGNCRD